MGWLNAERNGEGHAEHRLLRTEFETRPHSGPLTLGGLERLNLVIAIWFWRFGDTSVTDLGTADKGRLDKVWPSGQPRTLEPTPANTSCQSPH